MKLLILMMGLIGFAIGATRSARATSTVGGPTSASCPDASLGETAADCPWAGIARIIADEVAAGRAPLPVIQSKLPDFYSRLKADTQHHALLQLWGNSINFDELAKGIVVEPKLVYALEGLFGLPDHPAGITDERIVHAGVEHTYGYLFSDLKTSFGYKRARWVVPTIERGFGLPEGTISPVPKDGSLLQNVSLLAGRIAFRNDTAALAALEKALTGAAAAIRKFDFSSLRIARLEETVSVPDSRVVKIRTDFVTFPKPLTGDTNSILLIYSVDDPASGGPKLITSFPIDAKSFAAYTDAKGMGDHQPVITRYNAFVKGLTGNAFTGHREMTEVPGTGNDH